MTGLDRDAARDALFDAHPADWLPHERWIEELLNVLEACVRPEPPQNIDRDALKTAITSYVGEDWWTAEYRVTLLDRVLALLRPVDGVVLTREEAALAWSALLYKNRNEPRASENAQRAALASRLEAAS